MPLDALHIKIVASELNETLVGGRIDKITAPSFGAVRFAIYANHKTHGLYISINPENTHIRLTAGERQELSSVPVFITHLKKHLIGASIERIDCIDNERIINIEFLAKSELGVLKKFTLVAELMGKHSNLILLNDMGKIQESFKHIPLDLSSKRQVLPGLPYVLAPPQEDKINPFDVDALITILSEFEGESLSSFLQKRVFGLAPSSIKEIIYTAFGKQSPIVLNKKNQELLTSAFTNFANPTNHLPVFSKNDFYFRPYLHLTESQENPTKTATLLEAIDGFYGNKSEKAKFNLEARRLSQIVKTALNRSEKRLAILLERQVEAENADDNKIKGELLIANLYKITKNNTKIEVDNYYTDPVSKMIIELTSDISPSKQAESYFKKYRKAKKTLEALVPQLEQTRSEIEYLESVANAIETAEILDDLSYISEELANEGLGNQTKQTTKNSKKKDKQKPKTDREILVASAKRTEFMGYIILTGKNNLQNDALVKTASPEDIWLHPKDFHGSHTVIINPKKIMPSDKVLEFAGGVCAKHSKAKLSETVPIDYTFIKFVSKPKGSKAGKVTYTNQKTIWIKPE
ncbi:MAG: NFACT family protein [Firmicutes bacterium]|nr:NFACT family protein [Bacillota bacterium]